MALRPLMRNLGSSSLSVLCRHPALGAVSTTAFHSSVPQGVDPAREEADAVQEAAPVPHANPAAFPELPFDDPKQAFQAKSTGQLLQSLAVFKACTIKPLVRNADTLLSGSRRLAPGAVDWAVRHTLFRHFCGGECVESIQPTLQYLERNGIRPILNYAAEDDVSSSGGAEEPCEDGTGAPGSARCPKSAALERALDANLRIFMRSIADSDNARNRAFVAMKVTALGPPNVLERVSDILREAGDPLDRGFASAALRKAVAPKLAPGELASYDAMVRRLDALVDAVVAKGNARLLWDAEHTYMQPAIDALAIRAQQRCNRAEPVVLNTYQCYLRDAAPRIEADMGRAAREGWAFGAKTVRGAYMYVERARAAALGYTDPIQPSLQATHANYDSCVERILERVADGRAELMVASHKQGSVQAAARRMHGLGLAPATSGVYFGQLLGMADHLSFTLGRAGYRIHKIVPYGPLHECLQYLIRRAQENSDVLGGCGQERAMIRAELLRRLREDTALARALASWPRGMSAAA